MSDLDTILSGGDDTTSTEPAAATERPRGEDGRWLPYTETEAESTAPPAVVEPTPPETPAPAPVVETAKAETDDRVPQAALLDERRKRQHTERELQTLRAEIERLKGPTPPTSSTPETEDFWTAPEKALSATEKRAIAAANARIDEVTGHLAANFSERFARRQWPDYDAKRAAFAERLEADPVIKAEFNRHIAEGGDLGEFVYETGARLLEYAEQRDPQFREKVRAEERAKLEAEMRATTRPNVPQSLNGIPSAPVSTETWSGPPPLDAILKRH
jgi:hypothetical protein